jgi:hypothetical protein
MIYHDTYKGVTSINTCGLRRTTNRFSANNDRTSWARKCCKIRRNGMDSINWENLFHRNLRRKDVVTGSNRSSPNEDKDTDSNSSNESFHQRPNANHGKGHAEPNQHKHRGFHLCGFRNTSMVLPILNKWTHLRMCDQPLMQPFRASTKTKSG